MGRYLDQEERNQLAEMAHISLGIYRRDSLNLPADVRSAQLSLDNDRRVRTTPLDPRTIAGYGSVHDLFGQPALILKITRSRSIYQQGRMTIVYFFLWVMGIGAALSIAIRILRVRLISAQKKSKEMESRYRILVENAKEGILLLDGKTKRILEANPAISRMTGLSESELRDLPFQERIAFYLDSIGLKPEDLEERDLDHPLELKISRKDGSTFDAEINFKRFMAGDQPLISLIIRDVSERKRAESAKLEGVIQTVKTLHHEVSSPLQALTGSLDLMKLGAMKEREAKHCGRIEAASQRIVDILHRLGSLTEVATTTSVVGDRVLLPEKPTDSTHPGDEQEEGAWKPF
jgi:PAS domain S-box-containing protein